ncbi:hypothetical protein [Mycobacterium bourgelatii]|uniref:ARB-07466-like C-terminal domain-containing protein n=1 Tax=Mycobacterium bourgelatii TaxID=1273442 RepID=A0A7I9YP43_MYCBU|nr:hypothetical protein [Mycobacterium bourgelatii]MCV6975330.1 hypothetical protein [Mycobacterium bourgelatii]GFG90439.1 hypothetical protein MBOU_24810 [Mycobacterium bourgelatii]
MSGGAVKLASGYIELTVKKAGNAMKEITAEITGIEKAAKKASEAARDVIVSEITEGARDAGKAVEDELTEAARKAGEAVEDELTEAARKAGEEAGKAAGEALDEAVTEGAKSAGKKVQEEITSGAQKAGRDASKINVEPKVTPKADTKSARDKILKDLGEAFREAAEDAGYTVEEVVDEAARKLGGAIGRWLHDSPIGDFVGKIQDAVDPVVDAVDHFWDVLDRARREDPLGPLKDNLREISKELEKHKDSDNPLERKLGKIGGHVGNIIKIADGLRDLLALLNDPKTEETLSKIPGIGVADNILHKWPQQAGQWLRDNLPFKLPDLGNAPGFQKLYGNNQGGNDNKPAAPPPMPQSTRQDLQRMLLPPGSATGGIAGVTPAGRIYGPGTGTSDSIIGVDASGVPTVRVSNGEGIIRKAAMDAGADKLVAAINSGWLPRLDDGGVIPAPDPMMLRWFDAIRSGRLNPAALMPGGAKGSEGGLQSNTVRARRIISALFPEVGEIGGARQDSKPWHPRGLALDIMIPGWNTPQGKALGDQINSFIRSNAGILGSDYTMWQVPDHFNHVHANFAPSGFPGKDAQFGLPPAFQAMLGAAAGNLGGSAGSSQSGGDGSGALRTEGFIPAGAGGSGTAGTSFASGMLNMGAEVINGLIDQAASAASSAVAAGISAGSMGAGAAGGGQGGAAAAQFAIGLGTNAAKRGVSFGFQAAGIGIDALAEIMMPFGVPRFFQTDPLQFMPQLPGALTAVTTGEKAELEAHQGTGAAPGLSAAGPVQPGQLPGAQTIGPGAQTAAPGGVPSAPAPVAPGPSRFAGAGSPPPAGGPVVPTPRPDDWLASSGIIGSGPSILPSLLPTKPPGKPPLPVGVYDRGGWLPPGGIAINQTTRPEPMPVFTSEQWGTLQALSNRDVAAPDPNAFGGRNDYTVRIDQVVVKDVNELQREIDTRQRLQMMRHAGRP